MGPVNRSPECSDLVDASREHEAAIGESPDDVDVLLDAAEFYLDEADEGPDPASWLERAAELARTALGHAGSPDAATDCVLVETDALSAQGRTRDAVARLDRALRDRRADARLLAQRGALLFELCRFAEARRDLQAAVKLDADEASAHHTLGLIAERSGDEAEASARFALAKDGDPERFPTPPHLPAPEFDAAIEAAMRELPPRIHDWLSNVAVVVEDVPSDDDLLSSDPPLSPCSLGMFRGSPLGDKESPDPWSHFPSSIVLYQRNLERFAADRDELVEEIRTTLLHEVGHFVGLDEERLRELGLD